MVQKCLAWLFIRVQKNKVLIYAFNTCFQKVETMRVGVGVGGLMVTRSMVDRGFVGGRFSSSATSHPVPPCAFQHGGGESTVSCRRERLIRCSGACTLYWSLRTVLYSPAKSPHGVHLYRCRRPEVCGLACAPPCLRLGQACLTCGLLFPGCGRGKKETLHYSYVTITL